MDKQFFIKNLLIEVDNDENYMDETDYESDTQTVFDLPVAEPAPLQTRTYTNLNKSVGTQKSLAESDQLELDEPGEEEEELRLKSGAQICLQLPVESLPMVNIKPIMDISQLIHEIYFIDPVANREQRSNLIENRVDTTFIDHDVRESPSINSYVQLQTPSTLSLDQFSLMCPDDTYTLYDKIDQSGFINLDKHQLPTRPHLGEKLRSLLKNRHAGDFTVYIGDSKFRCHLCVLQIYSNYFKRCQLGNACQVRLPKLTARAFYIVYNWMLQDEPIVEQQLSNRCLLEVHQAAQFLGIPELVTNLWIILNVRENEAFKLWSDLLQLNVPDCETVLIARISRFFLTLVSSEEFVELDENYVCRLLSSHNLGVNSEIEIFYSAVRWLSHNWPERQEKIPQLLSCVRFGLLPAIFLRFLQSQHSTQVMHSISQNSLAKELINKAFIVFSTELYCRASEHKLPFKLPKYECPVERKWLFDKNCSYHQTHQCSQRQFFSYQQFLDYLSTLHETGPDYWQSLPYLDELEGF